MPLFNIKYPKSIRRENKKVKFPSCPVWTISRYFQMGAQKCPGTKSSQGAWLVQASRFVGGWGVLTFKEAMTLSSIREKGTVTILRFPVEYAGRGLFAMLLGPSNSMVNRLCTAPDKCQLRQHWEKKMQLSLLCASKNNQMEMVLRWICFSVFKPHVAYS